MCRVIISLILKVILLACASILGVMHAITNPTWILLLYGEVIMGFLLMTSDSIRDLVKVVRSKRDTKERASTDEEG